MRRRRAVVIERGKDGRRVRRPVVDLRLLVLQVDRAQGGVRVGGVGQQRLQVGVRARPLIQAGDHRAGDKQRRQPRADEPLERVHQAVDAVADRIAHGRGTRDRDEQVRAWPDAGAPERERKAVVVARHAEPRGHIEQPEHAVRGVDGKAHDRGARLGEAALQQVVGRNHRLMQVGEDILDASPHRPGQRALVSQRGRPHEVAIERLVDREADPVHRLGRIVVVRGGLGGRCEQHGGYCRQKRQ